MDPACLEDDVVLVLRLSRGSEPPAGWVGTAGGPQHSFYGWAALAAVIAASLRMPDSFDGGVE